VSVGLGGGLCLASAVWLLSVFVLFYLNERNWGRSAQGAVAEVGNAVPPWFTVCMVGAVACFAALCGLALLASEAREAATVKPRSQESAVEIREASLREIVAAVRVEQYVGKLVRFSGTLVEIQVHNGARDVYVVHTAYGKVRVSFGEPMLGPLALKSQVDVEGILQERTSWRQMWLRGRITVRNRHD
jgi:uncharacterized membrane protein YbhN (UPF0104 family)